MLAIKSSYNLSCRSARVPNSRRRAVYVAARSKDEIDEEWRAQQELLEFRRRKMEAARVAREAQELGEQVSIRDAVKSVGRSTSLRTAAKAPTKTAPAAVKADPVIVVEEEPKQANSSGGNPFGLLGKLFGQ